MDNLYALFLIVVFLGLPLALIGGVILLIVRATPFYKRSLEKQEAEPELAAKVAADYANAGIAVYQKGSSTAARAMGAHAGVAFEHEISPGGRAVPSEAVVTVPSELRGDFVVRRGSAGDNFLRRVGVFGGLRTGDAAFDRDFFLQGASREYLQAVFADAHRRVAVRALFELGFDRVELKGGKVSAIRMWGPVRPLELPLLRSTVERLAGLR